MRLHVRVKGKRVAHLYRQAHDYALRYIEAAGFSDADRADTARQVIGRSELLADPDKGN